VRLALIRAVSCFLLWATSQGVLAAGAQAEIRIAATVAPVHSLVTMVADGVTTPSMIIRPGVSPHNYALKPSEAQALNDADVVFWVGEGLEPWMAKAVTTLASDAAVIELGDIDGLLRLDWRKGGVWTEDDHDHDDDGHDHGVGFDPHLWLDPDNAKVWLDAIADALASFDPPSAEIYRENAKAAKRLINTTAQDIEIILQPFHETPYLVFHDAYQYFERRFDLHPMGAISVGDADRPGPARLMEIRDEIQKSGAVCIFSEPQFGPGLIETVAKGSEIRRGMLDPIGMGLEPGAGLYPELLRGLAADIADCLA